jgi:hypothetical protein
LLDEKHGLNGEESHDYKDTPEFCKKTLRGPMKAMGGFMSCFGSHVHNGVTKHYGSSASKSDPTLTAAYKSTGLGVFKMEKLISPKLSKIRSDLVAKSNTARGEIFSYGDEQLRSAILTISADLVTGLHVDEKGVAGLLESISFHGAELPPDHEWDFAVPGFIFRIQDSSMICVPNNVPHGTLPTSSDHPSHQTIRRRRRHGWCPPTPVDILDPEVIREILRLEIQEHLCADFRRFD